MCIAELALAHAIDQALGDGRLCSSGCAPWNYETLSAYNRLRFGKKLLVCR